MATFVVTIGKRKVESDATEVDIGTRSSCVISLDDPIAAERHAKVRLANGVFTIEDAGSSTGTWCNGLPVAEPRPIATGDVIIIGCARVAATVGDVDGKKTLTLKIDEKSFYYQASQKRLKPRARVDAPAKKEYEVVGDRDDWSRSEVAFGRFRPLSIGNAAAAAMGITLLLVWALPFPGKTPLQPGELVEVHAVLFARSPEAFATERLRQCAKIAHEQGCNACHAAFHGAPTSKCANCHADLMTGSHPFPLAPDHPEIAGVMPLATDACASCHVDHQGAAPGGGLFVYTRDQTKTTCERCHPNGVTPAPKRKLESVAARDVEVAYDFFPHAKHDKIGCAECHQRSDAQAASSGATHQEFAVVPFKTCMGCHASDDEPREEWKLDDTKKKLWAAKPEHHVRVDWHGANDPGSRCTVCHEKLYDKALHTTETRKPERLDFALVRREHSELFADAHLRLKDAHGSERRCVECHVSGKPLTGGTTVTGKFDHALHVQSLATPPRDDEARRASSRCRECHVEQLTAQHLAGQDSRRSAPATADWYPGAPSSATVGDRCAECHQDGHTALAIQPLEPKDTRATTRTDFPHDVHLKHASALVQVDDSPVGRVDKLAFDCFACHSFESRGDAFDSLPTTLKEAQSCMLCHDAHRNVGGGSCAFCHPQNDRVYANRRYPKNWPAPNAFRHDSLGHKALLADNGCIECHSRTTSAETVAETVIPTESDASCWKCHVDERQRFHWRGASMAASAAEPRR
jgi:hypothetical protein